MKRTTTFHAAVMVGFLSLGTVPFFSFAGTYQSLNIEDQVPIDRGEQVVKQNARPGEVWPETIVYQRIDATAEEVTAVLTDYAQQAGNVHKMKKSTVMQPEPGMANPLSVTVAYEMAEPDLPFFLKKILHKYFHPEYTVANTLSYDEKSKIYKIDWNLVKAETLKTLTGSAVIEPLSETTTLVTYTNSLSPRKTSKFYRLPPVKAKVREGSTKMLQSIVDYVHRIKKDERTLNEKVQKLREILSLQ